MARNDWNQTIDVELEEDSIRAIETRAEALGLLPGEFAGLVVATWLASGESLAVIEP